MKFKWIFCLFFLPTVVKAQDAFKLWYQQPAEKWTEALPIGNGRMGAMIYGGVQEDHLQFNESSFLDWNAKGVCQKRRIRLFGCYS